MKQATLNLNPSTKKTRKQVFLDQMEQVIPWDALVEWIAPYYPEGKTGRPQFSLCTMQCFSYRLEKHKLAHQILTTVNELLNAKGLLLKASTVVDATLIAAVSSIKNNDKSRDPEMHSSKMGEQMYFGMKTNIDVDADSRMVHTVRCTSANAREVTEGNSLLFDEEVLAWGDVDNQVEKLKASVRAKVEHPFRVIKRQFGYEKVRYRGLRKNTAQLITEFALSNLWMERGKLTGAGT